MRTIGSTKDWFPSRRSVASQRGALSIVREGHCRFGMSKGLNRLYFFEGSLSLSFFCLAFTQELECLDD